MSIPLAALESMLPDFRTIVLNKVRFGLDCAVGCELFRNHLDLQVHLDRVANNLAFRLRSWSLGKAERSEESSEDTTSVVVASEAVPADWWQAVRQRWLPAWLLRRRPVRTRTIKTRLRQTVVRKTVTHTTNRLCPHLNVHADGNEVCLQWLASGDEVRARP